MLATLFLIVTFATLAMPGSANFVGELLVLFGTFEDQLVYGLVASAGVALAAVYMIRVFQRTMHNRPGPKAESREIDGINFAAIAPLVAVIVALGVVYTPRIARIVRRRAYTFPIPATKVAAHG